MVVFCNEKGHLPENGPDVDNQSQFDLKNIYLKLPQNIYKKMSKDDWTKATMIGR